MTVRIAITMATMGRLMKNRDMALFPLERLRVDDRPRSNLLQSLDNHAFARFYAVADDPLFSDCVAQSGHSNRDSVGAIHHGDLVSALQVVDCLLRYQQSSARHLRGGPHSTVLSRPQAVAGIRKQTRKA